MSPSIKSGSARLKRLLEVGYFPEELPPPFNSADLAKYRKSIAADLPTKIKNKKGKDVPWRELYTSVPTTIYFPRFGRQDRKHQIVNPISFLFLAQEIANNWMDLRKVLKKGLLSSSPIIFNWSSGRALIGLDFDQRGLELSKISVRNNHVLLGDIARFYHSIYTHSIAWAVHSKAVAKKNRSLSLLGNRLDLFVRNGQDGQTIGLPVGPETSRIIAEVIASAIDKELIDAKVDPDDATRFVDDFAIGSQTREEAERWRTILRRTMHRYELELSDEKTSIRDIIRLDYGSWRHEVLNLRPGFGSTATRYELFFDGVERIANQNPHANVLRYALKSSRAVFVFSKSWSLVEDYLLLCYRQNHTILPTLVQILVNRHVKSGDVDKNKVALFLGSNILRLYATERHGELAWLFYLASELSIELKRSSIGDAFKLMNPVTALHICHLRSLNLIDKPIDRSQWNKSLNADGLRSEMWLYAYEASLKGWTGVSPKKFIDVDPGFAPLKKRKVSFFDISHHVEDITSAVNNDIAGSKKKKVATQKSVLEFDFDDILPDDEFAEGDSWNAY